MKKPLIFAFATLSTFALAAGMIVYSNGTGTATGADGRVGRFDYRALKRTDAQGRPVKFEGRLRFEQVHNDHGPAVLIEMGVPDNLGGSDSVCEFGGKGVLVTLVNGKRKSFGGRVNVRAVDRHSPDHPDQEPDLFRIRFAGERELSFVFEGRVNHGDLVVGKRNAP